MRLIDADAIEHCLVIGGRRHGKTIISEIIHRVIQTAPTVDAVPVRHGMWLPKHHYIAGYEFVSGHICSECGDDALNAEGDEFLTDYCPTCGAKMDAERKEECGHQ